MQRDCQVDAQNKTLGSGMADETASAQLSFREKLTKSFGLLADYNELDKEKSND